MEASAKKSFFEALAEGIKSRSETQLISMEITSAKGVKFAEMTKQEVPELSEEELKNVLALVVKKFDLPVKTAPNGAIEIKVNPATEDYPVSVGARFVAENAWINVNKRSVYLRTAKYGNGTIANIRDGQLVFTAESVKGMEMVLEAMKKLQTA